jgi:hypothetical protein
MNFSMSGTATSGALQACVLHHMRGPVPHFLTARTAMAILDCSFCARQLGEDFIWIGDCKRMLLVSLTF